MALMVSLEHRWLVDVGFGDSFREPLLLDKRGQQVLTDYAEMCRYHQTSPQSHFTRKRICSRASEEGRITLSDMRFITTSKGGERQERTLTSEEEYAAILREQFGIVMTG